MSEQDILSEIRKTAYWRVLIRPTEFQQDRIASLSACLDTIEKAKVSLRGWDYPHTERNQIVRGQEFIEHQVNFMGHAEYWRLYQSGQFVNYFSSREETRLKNLYLWNLGDRFQILLSSPSPSPTNLITSM